MRTHNGCIANGMQKDAIKVKKSKVKKSKEDSTHTNSLFSHEGFFDRQIENNAGRPEIAKYQKLVEFLHGKDEDGKTKFSNVLSLPKQISYADYLKLKEVESGTSRTLSEVLNDMENKVDLKKKYENVYLTANNWLKNEFKK